MGVRIQEYCVDKQKVKDEIESVLKDGYESGLHEQSEQIIRNCVNPEISKFLLEEAFKKTTNLKILKKRM